MIRFSLICDANHAFDSWFADSAAFAGLQKAGQLNCPQCGSGKVEKALMAPAVVQSRSQPSAQHAAQHQEAEALAQLRRQVEENSDYVGSDFATEARKMHQGDAPERSIYGEAKLEEAKELIEEGIPVLPLPFLPGRKLN